MIREGDRKAGRLAYKEQSGSGEKVLAMKFRGDLPKMFPRFICNKVPCPAMSNFMCSNLVEYSSKIKYKTESKARKIRLFI